MEQQVIYQVASNWLPPIPHAGFPIYLFSLLPSEASLHLYLRLVWKQFCWWSAPSLSLYHQDAGPLGAAWGSVSLARKSFNSTVSPISPFNSQPSWRTENFILAGVFNFLYPRFSVPDSNLSVSWSSFKQHARIVPKKQAWRVYIPHPFMPSWSCLSLTHRPEPPRMWRGRGGERQMERGFWGSCWRLLPSW